VSASDWASTARLQNHIASRGRVLVPAFRPDHVAVASKTAYTYALRVVPSYQALVRRWRVAVQCATQVDVSINGGTAAVDPSPGDFADIGAASLPRGITIDEVLGSQTSAESAATVTITGDSVPTVDSIECFELPRAFIASDANELGVELPPLRSSLPIQAAAFTNLYAGAMNADAGRRVLFQWAVPYEVAASTSTTYAASTASATFGDVFSVAKPCIVRKKFNDGNDYTACNARVFAWVSGGGSGQFRVITGEGDSSVVTITNTSPAWSSEVTDALVLHEDLTAADGLPGGYDDVQFEFRATSGTLYVASVILNE
jgi:hypothetical protein